MHSWKVSINNIKVYLKDYSNVTHHHNKVVLKSKSWHASSLLLNPGQEI